MRANQKRTDTFGSGGFFLKELYRSAFLCFFCTIGTSKLYVSSSSFCCSWLVLQTWNQRELSNRTQTPTHTHWTGVENRNWFHSGPVETMRGGHRISAAETRKYKKLFNSFQPKCAGTHQNVLWCFPYHIPASLDQVEFDRPGPPANLSHMCFVQMTANTMPCVRRVYTHTHRCSRARTHAHHPNVPTYTHITDSPAFACNISLSSSKVSMLSYSSWYWQEDTCNLNTLKKDDSGLVALTCAL